MKTILVTGASGFVGTYFIRQYSDQYKILALWRSNVVSGSNVMSLQLDLSNKQLVYETLQRTRPDVILHLAGKAKTWGSDLDEMIADNLHLTKNLLEGVTHLKEKEDYDPKVLIISSAEVYGSTVNPKSIDENAPFFPISEYGLTKMFVDRLAYYYAISKKVKVTILRSFNHIGPGQKLGFFVSDMASQISLIEKGKQEELTVGNLSSIRDVLDVRDVIRAYYLAIESNLPVGEAYNICSGKGVSMKQLLEKLVRLSTAKITIIEDESRMRASDNPISVGDNKKFRSATKWNPQINLDQTLSECLDYWRNS